MPFDATPLDEIANLKLAVQKVRAEGRLICDNYHKVSGSSFAAEVDGVVYVCALGAWEAVSHKDWSAVVRNLPRTHPFREYAHALMWVHDELFTARKVGSEPAIARAEKAFNALLA